MFSTLGRSKNNPCMGIYRRILFSKRMFVCMGIPPIDFPQQLLNLLLFSFSNFVTQCVAKAAGGIEQSLLGFSCMVKNDCEI